MATGNNRDVRLAVEIDTVGEESLRRAGDELKRLAKEGGAAAPELSALAAQFDKLADQSGALATFRQLGAEVDKLKAAQAEAAAAAGALGDKLAEVKTKGDPLRKQQTDLAEGVRLAEIEFGKADAALKTYAAGFDRAGKQTAEFTAGNKIRVEAQQKAKVSLKEEEAALERVAEALKRVIPEENKLQRQYEAQQARLNDANEALRQRERALRGASEAALAAGASTTDLAASEAELLRATQETVGATRRLADEQGQAAIAARLADAEFAKNVTTLRELDAAARALGEADGAAAMQKLEQGARKADAEFDKLVASLKAAETAAEEYAAATARAAGASRDDTQATQSRQVAAQRLLDVERSLTLEQREAAAARNAGRAAILAEAQALLQQAAAARESQAATVAAATAARQAGAAIESAFGAVGIRSIDAIEQEIEQTGAALARLSTQARAGGVGLDDLTRAAGAAEVKIARLRAEILQVQSVPGTFERLSTGLNGLVTRFGALTAVIGTIGVVARPVIESTVALDQMRRVLTTVTGSAEVAEQQVAKLRVTAQQAGVSFTEVGQSYAKFAASALQSGLTLNQVNSAFDSVALAAGNLGLSSDQAKRALEALSQIAAKGTVSMEELRQQLGDALPGVLPLLAKELGLTQRELLKVVESGGLLASDGIPAIDRALRQLGPASGQVEGLVATFNRFKNVVLEAGTAVVEGPLGQALGPVLVGAAQAVGVFATIVVSASEAMKVLGVTTLATLDAIRGNTSFAEAGKTISDFAVQSGEKIKAFQDRVDAIGGSSGEARESLDRLGKTAGLTGESFAKLTLEQQKSIDAAAGAAQSAEKNVQAAKAQADALVRTVALLGDEAAARVASAAAADLMLRATEAQLTADRALLASFEAQKAATLEQVRLGKQTIENVKTLIEETDKKIAKGTADVEKTLAQADAARAFARAQKLVVESAGDQSKSLDDLRKSAENAAAAQVLASRRYAEGKGSLDSLKQATDALALAKGLLRDAFKDQDEAAKRSIDSIKVAADVTKAEIALEITKLEIKKQNLLLLGREKEANRLDLEIKRLQLSSTKAGTEAKRAEAKAVQDLILLQFEDAKARGALTPAMLQELSTRYDQQRAILLETEASRLNEEQQRKSIDAAVAGTSARRDSTTAVGDHTGAVEGNTSKVGSNTDALRSNEQAKKDNAAATTVLAAETEKYAAALDKARREAGISGNQYGPGSDNTLGQGAADSGGPSDGDVFTDAGRQARNDSFKSTPFVSGSTGGGSYSTGQAANKPPGAWEYTTVGFDVPGADASGNRLPGGWKAIKGPSSVSGWYEPNMHATDSPYDLADPFGYKAKAINVAANAAAGTTGLSTAEADRVALENARIAEANRPTTVRDTDTPGTYGQYTHVPILGKYEVSFRNEKTGRDTHAFTDTAEQAQAFIDNLQQAFRSSNGG